MRRQSGANPKQNGWCKFANGKSHINHTSSARTRRGGSCLRDIYIRLFSSIELACAVRQPSPCLRAFCENAVLFHMSHLKSFKAPLRTSHFSLRSSHSTLHTALFALQTSHSILHSPHFTRLTSHCFLHTPNLTLHTSHCALHTPN